MANSGAIGTVGANLGLATGFTGLGGLAGIGMMLGGMFGGGDEEDPTQQLQEYINATLNQGLNQALNYSQQHTTAAVNQTNQSLSDAIKAITGYSDKAQQAALGSVNQGFNLSQQLRAPYSGAGYDALDAYKKTLGLNTPVGGTNKLIQDQQMATALQSQLQPLLKSLNGSYTATAPTAPTLKSLSDIDISSPQAKQAIADAYLKNQSMYNEFAKLRGVVPVQQLLNSNFDNSAATIDSVRNIMYANLKRGDQDRLGGYDVMQKNATNAINAAKAYYDQAVSGYQQNQLNAYNNPLQQQYDTALKNYNTQSGTIGQVNQLLQGANPQVQAQLAQLLRGKI